MVDPVDLMRPGSKRVLLAGATGYIGRAVARELVARGHRCTALVRSRPAPAAEGQAEAAQAPREMARLPTQVDVREASLTDPQSLHAALRDDEFDAVISCIASRSGAPADAWHVEHDANLALLGEARVRGAGHFVLLSAICVQRPRLAFQHAKLAFEKALQESDLTWSIVRPTAFFKSLAGQVERVKAGKSFLVFGDGRSTACKPISERDLACYLVDCLHLPGRFDRILPMGGPGPAVTPRDQAAMLEELTGQPVRVQGVTPRLFDLVLAVLGPLARLIPALAGKAEFARIGRYYATESMLLWDEAHERYDADGTPSTGSETLRDFYARVLAEGMDGQELGEHKLF